jgi:hypothetical protein
MNLLRALLVFWLSLAVPTTAVAAATQSEHCNRMAAVASTSGDSHAGHDMQNMSHAQHMQDSPAPTPEDTPADGCQCGCNCSSHHCASSASSLLTGLHQVADFSVDDQQRAFAVPLRTASAHHLDLLRPPSLT